MYITAIFIMVLFDYNFSHSRLQILLQMPKNMFNNALRFRIQNTHKLWFFLHTTAQRKVLFQNLGDDRIFQNLMLKNDIADNNSSKF